MKKKIVWLGVSWLMVAALVSVSCGPTVPEEEEEEEEEEEVAEVVTLRIGETYQTSEIAVTVLEVIVADSYEYYDKDSDSMLSAEAIPPGRLFVIANVYTENVGDDTRWREGRARFHVTDSEGNRYLHRAYFGEDGLPIVETFPVGGKMEGRVLFNLPEGATGLRVEYVTLKVPYKLLAEWVIE